MTPPIALTALLPEILLAAGACVVLLLGLTPGGRRLGPWVTLAVLVGAAVVVLTQRSLTAGGSGLVYGSLAYFVRIAALELGVLITLVNWSQAASHERGEFLSLLLLSLTGLLLVGAANDLVMLFLALELTSIPTYILIVMGRTGARGAEGGTKYFYLGALAAAIIAYGFSFLYGVAGTASLTGAVSGVSAALQQPGTPAYGLAMAGVVLTIGGLLFKLAAVPLHFYIADVYQGAPSPVAGLLGFVPKLAGLAALFRIVLLTGHWSAGVGPVFGLLWIVAVASMTVGNVLALRQVSIKRLLAYSGVAHAGYMLVGVLAGPLALSPESGASGLLGNGLASVLYYVVVYGIANLGAFAVLGMLRTRAGGEVETLRDVAGLLRREPAAALLLALAMFTLMGLPPTPGFWGKLGLFGSALAAARVTSVPEHGPWLIALVIVALLNSALAAAYYLRVIAAVLLYDNDRPAESAGGEAPQVGALLCGFLLVIFAFVPSGLLASGLSATAELSDAALAATPGPAADVAPPDHVVPHDSASDDPASVTEGEATGTDGEATGTDRPQASGPQALGRTDRRWPAVPVGGQSVG